MSDVKGRKGGERIARGCTQRLKKRAKELSTCCCHYLNGMAVGKGVEAHGAGVLSAEKVGPYLKLRVGVVDGEVFDPGGKPFIEPQMSPPLHSDLVM